MKAKLAAVFMAALLGAAPFVRAQDTGGDKDKTSDTNAVKKAAKTTAKDHTIGCCRI